MKKITVLLLSGLFGLTLLSACGGGTVAKITLNEDLDDVVSVRGVDEPDFFEPVQGVYPVIAKDGKLETTIEFVKTKSTSSTKYTADEFTLDPEDIDGRSIMVNNDYVEFSAVDKVQAVIGLLEANVGDHVKVTFSYIPADKDAQKHITERIVSCEVDLRLDEMEETEVEASALIDDDDDDDDDLLSESSSAGSSTNWDEVLNEYEKYVNSYVALYKKAMNGDMSAMNEYASMLENAQSLSRKLESAGSNLTAAQVARMNRINQKMLSAVK